eukprot:scaffold194140_cov35-Tisochrysis_lutea.AAC.3
MLAASTRCIGVDVREEAQWRPQAEEPRRLGPSERHRKASKMSVDPCKPARSSRYIPCVSEAPRRATSPVDPPSSSSRISSLQPSADDVDAMVGIRVRAGSMTMELDGVT